MLHARPRPLPCAGLLLALLACGVLAAQPAPDPKDPKADPKDPKKEGSKNGDKPVPPPDPEKDKMDFGKVPLQLKGNKFAFHLRDTTGKEGSSADYWGKVTLVYVVPAISTGPYLDELRQLKSVFKDHPDAALVCIISTLPERDGSHLKKAIDFAKAHQLPGDRVFLACNQIQLQVVTPSTPLPWFIFVGRDGKVQSSTWSWTKLMLKKAESELARLLPERAPEGKPADPLPLEDIKAPEVYKAPEQHNAPDSG